MVLGPNTLYFRKRKWSSVSFRHEIFQDHNLIRLNCPMALGWVYRHVIPPIIIWGEQLECHTGREQTETLLLAVMIKYPSSYRDKVCAPMWQHLLQSPGISRGVKGGGGGGNVHHEETSFEAIEALMPLTYSCYIN